MDERLRILEETVKSNYYNKLGDHLEKDVSNLIN